MLSPSEDLPRQLYQILDNLIPQDFNRLLVNLNVPTKVIPPMPAPQGDRTYALWNWAMSPTGCTIEKFQEELSRIIPERSFPSNNGAIPEPHFFPSSSAHIEQLTGTVPPHSPLYVEHKRNSEYYQAIAEKKVLIRIESPGGKWGKSSLLVRMLNYAQIELGYHTARISFDFADDELGDPSKLFKWFCRTATKRLGKVDVVEQFWEENKHGNDTQKCTWYFEEKLLNQVDKPIVLGLDSAGKLFNTLNASQQPVIARQFFIMLREWHEQATDLEKWQKLRLIISRSLAIPINLPLRQSPFNVGICIELGEFNESQIQNLSQKYGLEWSLSEIRQLMDVVGGQPYLIQTALHQIRKGFLTLEDISKGCSEESNLDTDYLRSLYSKIEDSALRRAFRTVINSEEPVFLDSRQQAKLRRELGLIKLVDTPDKLDPVVPFCNLYRRYFSELIGGES